MITGSRWIDLPLGEKWASRSASHRWLGMWQADGTLEKILSVLGEAAFLEGLIDWDRMATDVFFQPVKEEENWLTMDTKEKE